jgi:hypothetical protein
LSVVTDASDLPVTDSESDGDSAVEDWRLLYPELESLSTVLAPILHVQYHPVPLLELNSTHKVWTAEFVCLDWILHLIKLGSFFTKNSKPRYRIRGFGIADTCASTHGKPCKMFDWRGKSC